MATRTDTQSPALHVADSQDLIRVLGARENNLKDVSVEIPKRRLTVLTGAPARARARWCSTRSPRSRNSVFGFGFFPGVLALVIWSIATSIARYRAVATTAREFVATEADT
jgi:hypothetical protein